MPRPTTALAVAVGVLRLCTPVTAQPAPPAAPARAELLAAPLIRMTGNADSNSPALWQRINSTNMLFVMTSIDGRPSMASGRDLARLTKPRAVAIAPWPGGGVWMESVIADANGTWYGYYHNENVASVCRSRQKMIPRIGAARSRDYGATWQDLGIVLEAPTGSHDCITNNHYFVGGVGDFSVQLDPQSRDLYFFFSQYVRSHMLQGVGVARLAWADRDAPTGKAMVWRTRAWYPVTLTNVAGGSSRWTYSAAVPIFAAVESWHDDNTVVDAFWGPSVHWNAFLQQYVMLLNRASDSDWRQDGIYVSFAPSLDNPRLWSWPTKLLDGGNWYPQVVGLEAGTGTDKVAGEWARFFMSGASQHMIHFTR